MQHADGTFRQPQCDIVPDLRRGNWRRAQHFEGLRDGLGMTDALAGGALKQRGQIGALPVNGVQGQLLANLTDDAAGGLTLTEAIAQVALGNLPR